MRESAVERHLRRVVTKDLGGECLKFTSPGRRGPNDRLCIIPPESVNFDTGGFAYMPLVELKAPRKKPKPHQARFHVRMADLRAACLVFDTKEQINDWVRRIKR